MAQHPQHQQRSVRARPGQHGRARRSGWRRAAVRSVWRGRQRRGWGEQGTSALELAMILPVFLTFILGTLDFGRAVVLYNTASEAARDGARAAQVTITAGNTTFTAAQSQITAAQSQITAAALKVTSPLAALGSGMTIATTVTQDADGRFYVTTTATSSFQPVTSQFLHLGNIAVGATSTLAAACGKCR